MAFINVITELFSKLKDGDGNSITSTDLGDGKRGLDVNLDLGEITIGSVDIVDQEGDHIEIGPEGRLHITTALPHEVVGWNTFKISNGGAIPGHDSQIAEYLIPNGKKIIISEATVGGENGHNIGFIYYSATGLFEDAVIVRRYYFSGQTTRYELDIDYTGDGTAKIFTKVQRLSKGKRYVHIGVHGFVEQ